MRNFLITVLLTLCLSMSTALGAQNPPRDPHSCQSQVPWGWPESSTLGVHICRLAYTLLHDNRARLPVWVAYTLTPHNALGCVARSNSFQADVSLPNGQRGEPRDYSGSGFDMGHMAPNGDMSWDPAVERESFIMSNVVPQSPTFNRGIWKLLETSIRAWVVQRNHSYTIYTGPLYSGSDSRIGLNRVVVPHGFYKIVIDNNTREYAGWAFPHQAPYPNLGKDLTKFRVPVASIESATGVEFPVPPRGTELIVGREWSVDFGRLTTGKRSVCGINAPQD